ncbi:MAG TPA: hypothetical protein VN181_08555 [Thermoanaerobaculia bacterium]|nr:hypothetical protein [Thermoanaerobaculia bacterium]
MIAQPIEPDSTLIRRGTRATTLTEMSEFVATIEARPLDKLLGELPGIAQLSASKFDLARNVVRRRVRDLVPIEREQLRVHANEVASSAKADVAQRIRDLFTAGNR